MIELFEINMSRNKFIQFLHRKRCDKSFSELRSILKKNKWNMSYTYLELYGVIDYYDSAWDKAYDEIENAIKGG